MAAAADQETAGSNQKAEGCRAAPPQTQPWRAVALEGPANPEHSAQRPRSRLRAYAASWQLSPGAQFLEPPYSADDHSGVMNHTAAAAHRSSNRCSASTAPSYPASSRLTAP